MKKFLMCLSVFLLFGCLTAAAKTGDINGNIYSTDIKAVINGVEVPSYAIDGKTVVVVEEITDQYQYSNEVRSLTFNDLAPASLKPGQNTQTMPTGTVLGNTYETDIQVYLNGRSMPAYAIDGKMAVAIEDMGGDQAFNHVGGKYTWNPDTRTISLEYIYYRDLKDILNEKHLVLYVTADEKGDLQANFVAEPIRYGYVHVNKPDLLDKEPKPVYFYGEVIGYMFEPYQALLDVVNGKENFWFYPRHMFSYYYDERVAEILKDIQPIQPTAEQWRDYIPTTASSIIEEFETEEYVFWYLVHPLPMGGIQDFWRVDKKTGERIVYGTDFESVSYYGTKRFDNVVIDRENEIVTFRYDKDYQIDLKTGEMTPLQ